MQKSAKQPKSFYQVMVSFNPFKKYRVRGMFIKLDIFSQIGVKTNKIFETTT